ncbi:MAG: GNAT family N-acetyltransferase [Actinomycetota bacterium]
MDGDVATEGDLTIRRLRNEPGDLALMTRWRAMPHVHAWWDPDEPAPTVDEVATKYGERTHPSSPTTPCIIELGGRPVGYIQCYRWASFAEEARAMDVSFDERTFGLDVFIGEPDALGVGARAIDLLCRHLEQDLDASWIALITEVGNVRAQRAYEKAGFVKLREVLDLDMRDGERARCFLMERRR